MRQVARGGRADVVLAYDPDRLSRKLYHRMILAEEFEKQEIKLEFITQDMGTFPEGRMFFNMRGLVAEYEREGMELIQKEQGELEKRKAELERQLAQRFLVEKVSYDGQRIEILTTIPLSEQLHPIHRGG